MNLSKWHIHLMIENNQPFAQTPWGPGGISASSTFTNQSGMPFWRVWFWPRHTIGPRRVSDKGLPNPGRQINDPNSPF